MPNCNSSIVNWQTEGRELVSTPIPVAFTLAKNDTLFFELPNYQTVYFYFNLNLVAGTSPQVMISVYNASNYALVSSLTSMDTNINTNIDLPAGMYIVCLRSLKGNFIGTARADYYGFSRTVTFEPEVNEAGQECIVNLKLDPKPKPCNKPLKWEIVEGEMPPGLRMDTSSGLILGTLPWLDCLEDKESPFNDIPSANLFYKTAVKETQTVEPWGRRWDFKVRLYTEDQPENYDEKWYCVTIFNDWTRSTKKFFDNYRNENELGAMIVPKPKPYYFGLCPPNIKEIEKSVDHTLDNLISDWEGVTKDDDILFIDIDFDGGKRTDGNTNSNGQPVNLNPDNNNYTIFQRKDGKGTQQIVEIENDGDTIYGVYGTHNTTIAIDRDVIDVNDIYIPDEPVGHISASFTLEIEGWEHYLTYRQWLIALSGKLAGTKQTVQQYLGLDDDEYKLLQRYQAADPKVVAEYFDYFPDKGHEWLEGDEDTKGLSDKPMYFIYVYDNIEPEDLPEVKKLTEMIESEKEKGPWNVLPNMGETVTIELKI